MNDTNQITSNKIDNKINDNTIINENTVLSLGVM